MTSHWYKLRGIYSTALSHLLKKNGHKLVEPSKPVRDRLNIKHPREGVYDAIITDDRYKMAIRCKGKLSATKDFTNLMENHFPYHVHQKPVINPNAILVAQQTQDLGKDILVSLDDNSKIKRARIPKGKLSFVPDKKILVTAHHPPLNATKQLHLSTDVGLVGERLKLGIGNKTVRFSPFLDQEERDIFFDISHTFDFSGLPVPIKVTFRSSATGATEEEILDNFNSLKSQFLNIFNTYEDHPPGKVIYEGLHSHYFFLTYEDKITCDKLRHEVVPTVSSHHILKSLEEDKTSDYINLLEQLIAIKSTLEPELDDAFQIYRKDCLKKQNTFDIYHWRPNGRYHHLGSAKVHRFDEQEMTLKREVSSTGQYDGLNCEKEPGDTIWTRIPFGKWWLKHEYYSKNQELKGTYININSPVEISFNAVRYLDLILDVVKLPNEKARLVDQEELEEYVRSGVISQKLKEKILDVAKTLLNSSTV